MRLMLCLCLFPLAAAADCRDEILGLFDGGPLDPFAQPPYRYETTVTAADGSVRYEYVTVFDTPMRSLSGQKGQTMYLYIDRRSWSGPGPEGPWTEIPNSLPEDLEGFHKATRDQLAANLSDAECLGTVTADGASYTGYRYKTRTGPNPDGTFFGGTYAVYIDPDSNRLMRQEQTAAVAHYQPEPGTDTTVMVYTYDPAFALAAPD